MSGSPRPRVLTVAGSDSGGGAGIQADLKTFSALGAYGMTAITAVTVQNTEGVTGVEALSPGIVADQIRSVVTDIGVDAAKTGMLANEAIVTAVAEALRQAGVPNVVVDPVSVSKHGHALLEPDAVGALKNLMMPLATLVTPNLPEAGVLSGNEVETKDDMRRAAEAILELGPRAVLVKGGHLEGARAAEDLFVDGHAEEWISAEWIDTEDTHGTGCTISAAIATYLARGDQLDVAVRKGKAFVTEAIRHALRVGHGIGPVDQLWPIDPSEASEALPDRSPRSPATPPDDPTG